MFPFLNLPRELRDNIYETLLQLELPTPKSKGTAYLIDRNERIPFYDRVCLRQDSESEIHYQHIIGHAFTGLKKTNRQIRGEFQNAIARLPGGNAQYRLDIAIERYQRVYPTWLKMPMLSSHIHMLHIDIRILGDEPERGKHPLDMIDTTTRPSRTLICSALIGLLNRFTRDGPLWTESISGADGIKIDHLILNFWSRYPNDATRHAARLWADGETATAPEKRRKEHFTAFELAESFADTLKGPRRRRRGLSQMRYGVDMLWEEPIYVEHIGRLVLMLDGVVVKEHVFKRWEIKDVTCTANERFPDV